MLILLMECLTIRGISIPGNGAWDQVLASFSKIDRLKHFSLQVKRATSRIVFEGDESDDDEDQEQEQETVEGDTEKEDTEDIGNSAMHPEKTKERLLVDAINNLNIELDTTRGDDIESILINMAGNRALTDV